MLSPLMLKYPESLILTVSNKVFHINKANFSNFLNSMDVLATTHAYSSFCFLLRSSGMTFKNMTDYYSRASIFYVILCFSEKSLDEPFSHSNETDKNGIKAKREFKEKTQIPLFIDKKITIFNKSFSLTQKYLIQHNSEHLNNLQLLPECTKQGMG